MLKCKCLMMKNLFLLRFHVNFCSCFRESNKLKWLRSSTFKIFQVLRPPLDLTCITPQPQKSLVFFVPPGLIGWKLVEKWKIFAISSKRYLKWEWFCFLQEVSNPVCIYLFQLNSGNIKTICDCDISSKLTIKTSKRHYWHRSGVFLFKFEQISYITLV